MPLTFSYAIEPLHELLDELVKTRRAPVYVVHFTQKEAVERAQSLMSTPLASREQRDRIADEIAGFRFGPGFGRTLNRLLRHGVGVHHAGMLPKYRRVVERLTQRGLLPVVCGTDTLGVGINVPIRTVLLTSLVKYDGVRMRHLSAREFHQIAGRAGPGGLRHRRRGHHPGAGARDREPQAAGEGRRRPAASSRRSSARRRPRGRSTGRTTRSSACATPRPSR